jgi:hypothetical protein
MNGDKQECSAGRRAERRWKVVSDPDAIIQVEVLEMTDEIRRMLTMDRPVYLPPPNLKRWRRFWSVPTEA